ncbi:hypothetical protein Pph01_10090 [Planotetraspora phitsanulokensis]|uniref:Uncharacterized protein n=1 Tax=Planotetraspora phitsanulokensis TaxID=575192 RepID=A0A8J3XCW2_9ACTN|nr:hypothetical protein Pph01_10090 [Planotetraspora phitsanulokensis]
MAPRLEEARISGYDEPALAGLKVDDESLDVVRGHQHLSGAPPEVHRLVQTSDRQDEDRKGATDEDQEQCTRDHRTSSESAPPDSPSPTACNAYSHGHPLDQDCSYWSPYAAGEQRTEAGCLTSGGSHSRPRRRRPGPARFPLPPPSIYDLKARLIIQGK